MSSNDLISPADRLVSDARGRVETCRSDLRGLLQHAQDKYKATMSNLEQLSAGPTDRGAGPLSARMGMLQRSQLLHEAAGELDGAIARINEAVRRLDEAVGALEGRFGLFGPALDLSETSVEAVAIQAQEEERYRLAREIHDGPAQILANMALQLEYISKLATKDPVRARDEMGTIQKDLRLAVGEVRRFMYDLRPPALAQQGVGPAVESHCQRVSERFGLKCSAHWLATAAMSPAQDTAVFRMVQEALQNVVKHAQATQAEVQAVERDGVLEVSVSDNGKGFNPEKVHKLDPKHFGLAGMRARAQQIGATLEVTSTPGRGTTVLIRVPLG